MIYALVVPGPIEDVEEVRILEWHGAPATRFASGDLIVELETHKALVEVRAAHMGILRRILCAVGEWQKVGQPLALFSDNESEALPDVVSGQEIMTVNFEVT